MTVIDLPPAERFISSSWNETVRHSPKDEGTMIGLPFPYTVPCRQRAFQELYYWDTFYTNEGLLADGRIDLARSNVENFLHLVTRFGFVPNGNRTWFLSRSQPPHLAMMVWRIFAETSDTAWLKHALPVLQAELEFWQTRRRAACGLNHYGHQADCDELLATWDTPDTRCIRPATAPENPEDRIRIAAHEYAECESGWDYGPRFERRCMDFCPVDLNALLFASERIVARSHHRLGNAAAAEEWDAKANRRADLMRRLLWSESVGAFTDYDHVDSRHSTILSAAVFFPVWLGIADTEETERILDLMPRLERAHGILTCEPGPRKRSLQWDAPNAWPPLQYAAVQALDAAGRRQDADRVAAAFLKTVEDNFERTGDLWEKYNAETGGLDVINEYGLPSMMGWTAGVATVFAKRFAATKSADFVTSGA